MPDRRTDKAQGGKARAVEDGDRRVLEGRVEPAGLDLAQRVGVAVVVNDVDPRREALLRVTVSRRAGEDADFPLACRAAALLEIVCARERGVVLPRQQLQPVDEVGKRRIHGLEPGRHPLVAVQDDVDLSRAQEVRHLVPLSLEEARLDPEQSREPFGELHLEPGDLGRIVVARIDVRPASFLIRSPHQLAARADVGERVGVRQ